MDPIKVLPIVIVAVIFGIGLFYICASIMNPDQEKFAEKVLKKKRPDVYYNQNDYLIRNFYGMWEGDFKYIKICRKNDNYLKSIEEQKQDAEKMIADFKNRFSNSNYEDPIGESIPGMIEELETKIKELNEAKNRYIELNGETIYP